MLGHQSLDDWVDCGFVFFLPSFLTPLGCLPLRLFVSGGQGLGYILLDIPGAVLIPVSCSWYSFDKYVVPWYSLYLLVILGSFMMKIAHYLLPPLDGLVTLLLRSNVAICRCLHNHKKKQRFINIILCWLHIGTLDCKKFHHFYEKAAHWMGMSVRCVYV